MCAAVSVLWCVRHPERSIADLVSVLARVVGVEQLPAVFAAAGLEARWQDTSLAGQPAVEVARSGALPWLAVVADDPVREARRLARGLYRRGRPAGIAALDPGGGRLALAVAFGDVPVLELRLAAPHRTGLDALAQLAAPGESALAAASRAADALSVEEVGARFFRELRGLLERMESALPAGVPAPDRRSLALLQLTRVLFLYFVQSKGWLDGRTDFLARQIDLTLARRRRIDRDLLRPLFFGTLNRPAHERRRTAAAFGAIPFLNGGLFEPHVLERRWRVELPNELWRDAFDRLFERFRFSVLEADDPGVVAPDMLGRMFERLMAPADRRASGTFYTPAALVRRILRDGCAAALSVRLGVPDVAAMQALDERSPDAARALRDVALLDPAVGSGAFLVGAMDLLAELRTAQGEPSAEARRAVLRRNLFGVDLSGTAVRLAELRLWLAVVAAEPGGGPTHPLPNLHCLVRQGDSLIDPADAVPEARSGPALMRRLAELRQRLVVASGDEKRRLGRALREAEVAAAIARLDGAVGGLDRAIAERLNAARAPTLFGGRRGLDRTARAELHELRVRRRAARELRRRVAHEREVPWFSYETHFGDVMARGGFDLVVGNPPWVRAEELAPELRARLARRYRWWRSSGAGGWANRPDLSVAFVERALELAAPGGTIALLVPAKLATAAYATRCRHALATSTRLHLVADLTRDPDAAFDATVYPLALVAGKAVAPAAHRVRTTLVGRVAEPRRASVPQRRLGSGPWILCRTGLDRLRTRLAADHPPFSERFRCRLGVKTGADAVFVVRDADVEPELLRWALRGRDLRPFHAAPRLRLIWTHAPGGAPLPALPPRATRYFAEHRRRLLARTDYGGGSPWQLFRTAAAAAAHRVVWADLGRRLTAVALAGPGSCGLVPLNTCYVVATPSAAVAARLAAWLNATPVGALARLGAVQAAGGYARFGARTVGELPLPAGVLTDLALERIGTAGTAVPPHLEEAGTLQEELDACAAGLLGLSSREQRALHALAHAAGAGGRR